MGQNKVSRLTTAVTVCRSHPLQPGMYLKSTGKFMCPLQHVKTHTCSLAAHPPSHCRGFAPARTRPHRDGETSRMLCLVMWFPGSEYQISLCIFSILHAQGTHCPQIQSFFRQNSGLCGPSQDLFISSDTLLPMSCPSEMSPQSCLERYSLNLTPWN